jgi:hypothetical protein
MQICWRASLKDSDRRRLLKYLLAGSVAYPATSSAFWFLNKETKPIHRWSGSIKINGQPLQPTRKIQPGDTIKTGEDSEIVFTQGKDAYLLRSNTRMVLNNNKGVVDILRVLSGAVLSVFGSGKKQIKTPTAIIGIRGTGTYLEVTEQETYLCTCYGKTEITSNEDPSVTDSISTQHHEEPRFIRSTAQGAIIKKAPVRNHSDAELIMLESTVGRKPPFLDNPSGDDIDWGY